ncbi:tRNA modification GTPase [Hyunsoonleella sp. 2307UL5-6]|uniref:tRNA modification GTPase n=1 Tax=Hyunsoonleella sp. 2307UL5-6 TaxID=3384768 RepID=UPI0039BD8B85
MIKQTTLFLFLILGLNIFAQNTFLKGYYINNSNERIECLIKNLDWLSNPTEFEYKLSENSEKKIQTVSTVKEFEIYNTSKYIGRTVNIDRSSININKMGYDKNPVFNKEQLFLRVLIEGKANLYLYEDSGLIRYFFNEGLNDVEQLIFKNYLTEDGQVSKNNFFRRQLWNSLKCENTSMSQVGKINYRQTELVNFFIGYNECTNSEFTNYAIKQKKDLFNLTIRPGVRSASLLVRNAQVPWRELDFGKGLTSFRLGLEAEFILGFNNNKWSLIVEPTYQNFSSEAEKIINESSGRKVFGTIDYTSIDVNLGLRYYIFLNDDFKLFATSTSVFGISSSLIEIIEENSSTPTLLDINSGVTLALGVGCKYKEKYNLELRYAPKRNILNAQGAWGTEFTSVSLILGYTIF